MATPDLDPAATRLLAEARWATLTTIDHRDGRPRSVPICFVVLDGAIYSPLDEKPKAKADPLALRRVRNLLADARATILVHRWDEDWANLAFVELTCGGEVVGPGGPGHEPAVQALRHRYPQYASHRLHERPLLRFSVLGVTTWQARRESETH